MPWWAWLLVGWLLAALLGALIVVLVRIEGATRWEKPLSGKIRDLVGALPLGFLIAPLAAFAAVYVVLPLAWFFGKGTLTSKGRARRHLDRAILRQLHRIGLLANDLGGAFVADSLDVTYEQEIRVPVTRTERRELSKELDGSAWGFSGAEICWVVTLRRWQGLASVALNRLSALPDDAGEAAFWNAFPDARLPDLEVIERLTQIGAPLHDLELERLRGATSSGDATGLESSRQITTRIDSPPAREKAGR